MFMVRSPIFCEKESTWFIMTPWSTYDWSVWVTVGLFWIQKVDFSNKFSGLKQIIDEMYIDFEKSKKS